MRSYFSSKWPFTIFYLFFVFSFFEARSRNDVYDKNRLAEKKCCWRYEDVKFSRMWVLTWGRDESDESWRKMRAHLATRWSCSVRLHPDNPRLFVCTRARELSYHVFRSFWLLPPMLFLSAFFWKHDVSRAFSQINSRLDTNEKFLKYLLNLYSFSLLSSSIFVQYNLLKSEIEKKRKNI